MCILVSTPLRRASWAVVVSTATIEVPDLILTGPIAKEGTKRTFVVVAFLSEWIGPLPEADTTTAIGPVSKWKDDFCDSMWQVACFSCMRRQF